jgi:hypothetical protein
MSAGVLGGFLGFLYSYFNPIGDMWDQLRQIVNIVVCALGGLVLGAVLGSVRQSKRFSSTSKAWVSAGIIILIIILFREPLSLIGVRTVIFIRNGISL